MVKKKVKAYMYTRVSTSMQVDGYSLDAQKEKIRKYADAFEYAIVGEYEDAGKSGKSIAGRAEFKRMLEDIEADKDGVSYVLVFKLSRFGRNAADVLNSLQLMQDFGVNLICVEDGIDSSKDSGKLMIAVLSAVAKIERENSLVQTMEGRKQNLSELSMINMLILSWVLMMSPSIYFDKLYVVMEDADKRNLLSALIDEIQVCEEEQANGQWLKSIGFKLPIIDSEMDLGLDNDGHVETVCLLSKKP